MTVSTAAIVNAVLDLSALGALALVCRIPFRRAFQTAVAVAHAHSSQAEREQRAA
jgi:hypothetical protein